MTKTYARFAVGAVAGILLAASSTLAHAANDSRDVVRDSRGNAVVNSFGNCVRTQWHGGDDICGAPAQRQYSALSATTIGQDARTVYFEFDKANLTTEGKARLNSLAESLKSAEDVQQANIVGFADRIGNTGYNDKLSKERA